MCTGTFDSINQKRVHKETGAFPKIHPTYPRLHLQFPQSFVLPLHCNNCLFVSPKCPHNATLKQVFLFLQNVSISLMLALFFFFLDALFPFCGMFTMFINALMSFSWYNNTHSAGFPSLPARPVSW